MRNVTIIDIGINITNIPNMCIILKTSMCLSDKNNKNLICAKIPYQ